jgi:hypothetical protein
MELKEQLAQMMATLKNNFLQKYALFKSQNNFDSEAFIQETLQFYKQLETFNQKFIVSDAIPVSESFVRKCEEKIQGLSVDNPSDFMESVHQLILFLNGFLLTPTTDGTRSLVIPLPLNQEIVDTILRPQPDIIDAKKMEIINSGTDFDEEAFKKHNEELFFSRSLFREQLLENVIEAKRKDKKECQDANEDIENATASTFFDNLDAARALYDSKIVPVTA